MNGLPLHPALVHLPLGVAFVVPLVLGIVLVARRRGKPGRTPWLIALALQSVLFTGAVAATVTGESAEHSMGEGAGNHAAVEAHEEQAEAFTWVAGATLAAIGVAAVAHTTPVGVPLGAFALLLSVGGLGQGVRAGHAGGALVHSRSSEGVAALSGASRRSRSGAHPDGDSDSDSDSEDGDSDSDSR
jgi:hypothetical protein